jgi:lipid-A-disaccharide synthase
MSDRDIAADRPSPLKVFLVVGEESGDQLGAGLMRALRERFAGDVSFAGVGGAAIASEGLPSLFPLADIALMGFVSIAQHIPTLLARMNATVRAAIAAQPDVVVIIDSPDFTHRVARRIRKAAPHIPIVDYVSPSVWAWRSGRARAMRAYIDHVLALLPFEPDAHERLGGPPCTYVGHPLAEATELMRPNADEARRREGDPPVILVLPGSRRSEIRRLAAPFAGTIERLHAREGRLELVLPTLPHLADEIATMTARWKLRPRIVTERAEKYATFRIARAALAASGTVTLELALAGVPTVAAYRMAAFEALILRQLIRVHSVILANLVLGENAVPEFLQENCTPDRLAAALVPLLRQSPERLRQLDAFRRLQGIMRVGAVSPSVKAAEIVVQVAQSHKNQPFPGASPRL